MTISLMEALATGQLANTQNNLCKLERERAELLVKLFAIDRKMQLEILERDRLAVFLESGR